MTTGISHISLESLEAQISYFSAQCDIVSELTHLGMMAFKGASTSSSATEWLQSLAGGFQPQGHSSGFVPGAKDIASVEAKTSMANLVFSPLSHRRLLPTCVPP